MRRCSFKGTTTHKDKKLPDFWDLGMEGSSVRKGDSRQWLDGRRRAPQGEGTRGFFRVF